MNYELKKLTITDGVDIHKMLQVIPYDENGFINAVRGKTNDEYKQWLIRHDAISKGKDLEEWMVPSSIYWLYINGYPVGMGNFGK